MAGRQKIVVPFGARPNFIKVAALVSAWRESKDLMRRFELVLVHTQQHHTDDMSLTFLKQLGIEPVRYFLARPGQGHSRQTADIMVNFDQVLEREHPDWVVVVGDVNTTLACSLAAKKRGIRLAHVEAGLRSFNRSMPEEINRLAVDAISDVFFTTSRVATLQLEHEGVDAKQVHFVGNLMIDTLLRHSRGIVPSGITLGGRRFDKHDFALATLHRPSNVDDPKKLRQWFEAVAAASRLLPIVFVMHPRVVDCMNRHGMSFRFPKDVVTSPALDYLTMLDAYAHVRYVMTDSGGIQEETTVLGVPCLTLRAETERPETLSHGTNRIVGDDPSLLLGCVESLLASPPRPCSIPELWDGNSASRIFEALDAETAVGSTTDEPAA